MSVIDCVINPAVSAIDFNASIKDNIWVYKPDKQRADSFSFVIERRIQF